ncbi:hypothetical protein CL689_00765 [Candidatus Saccharibacteria bacterium]|nr:hypothetical protein [Candidatus Saccharibacteria bacterium]MBJ58608.1 hypothetical protein [Candidatus Saccharibacteria bacterium]MBQ68582.1 hypothetical protein [Candidatus Saccharibacteria bacterium]|tara:strand:- start:560 stop:1087 length:528 start_codon:yes stop_codon:yes gene_type:complete
MQWAKRQTGFTIVELLIVIVVIAILAAITIVAYNGIRQQANDSTVQSDLKNFVKLVELYNVKRGGYPTSTADLQWMDQNVGAIAVGRDSYAILFSNSDGTDRNFQYCYSTVTSGYPFAVVARSSSGRVYSYGGNTNGEYTGSIGGNWQSNCTGLGVQMSSNQTTFLYANGWASWL